MENRGSGMGFMYVRKDADTVTFIRRIRMRLVHLYNCTTAC